MLVQVVKNKSSAVVNIMLCSLSKQYSISMQKFYFVAVYLKSSCYSTHLYGAGIDYVWTIMISTCANIVFTLLFNQMSSWKSENAKDDCNLAAYYQY